MSDRQLNLHGFEAIAWTAVWLFAVLAAAVLIVVLLRYERKLVPRRVGHVLLAFRLGLLALLAWTFSQPVLSWTLDRAVAGRIVVAVDVSDSMATSDAHASPAEKLRWARALGMIGNDANRDRLDHWIGAYEAGREPDWFDDADNAADKPALASARQEHLQNVFAQVDALSRKEIARRLLDGANAPLLSDLADAGRVQLVAFAGGNLSIERETLSQVVGEPPAGLRTGKSDLSQALAAVTSDGEDSPVLGVVVLSDGRDNSGQEAARLAERLGQSATPVYPVMFGSSLRPRDLSIASLDYPQTVSKDDKPVVTAVLNTSGFGGEEIVVRLEREGADAIERKVRARDQTAEVQFQVDAADVGRRNYTLRVEPRKGETRADNNSRSFAMSVVDEKIRILLVDGEARWEFRFIDNALSRDPNVEIRRVVFRQPYIGALDEPFFSRTLSKPQPGIEPADSPFDGLDLVILGDVAPNDLTAHDWQQLDNFVSDEGGTLVFVAGKQNFPLGFSSPVVDRLLPLTDLRAVPVTGPAAFGPPSERGFHLALTPEAEKELMFQFADDSAANRDVWSSLPGHSWGVLGKAKPAATVFAEAVGIGDERALPEQPGSKSTANAAFVHQYYGAGQVLYIGIDSTWRWRHRVGDTYHHRFWGQLGRWAAENRSSVGNEFVQFGPEQTDIEEGTAVTVRARWSRQFLKRFPGLTAKAEISRSDAPAEAAPITTIALKPPDDRPQVAEGRVSDLPVGDYRIKLVAKNSDLGPAEISAPLYVTPFRTPELSDVAANPQLLTELAQAGGGRLLLPDQVHELPQLLARPEQRTAINRDYELWNHWMVLVLFFTLLTTEWIVRKLHGLP
ncbi:MAG: hypothetical protein WD648_00530 [Planctomycetaceae bacterium]